MQEYTIKEKSAIINLLSLIMEADKIIHPKEVEFMNDMMEKLHVTIADIDKMDNKDIESNKDIYERMSPIKKVEAMQMFKRMAEVDGNVDPREMEIINYL